MKNQIHDVEDDLVRVGSGVGPQYTTLSENMRDTSQQVRTQFRSNSGRNLWTRKFEERMTKIESEGLVWTHYLPFPRRGHLKS